MGSRPSLEVDQNTPPIKPTASWRANSSAKALAKLGGKETGLFRGIAWTFFIISSLYILAFLGSRATDDHVWIMHVKGYLVLIAMQVILLYLYHRHSEYIDSGPTLETISSQLPSDNALPTQLRVQQGKCTTGCDQGFVWFEDDILFYKGRQTAFRINREDCPPAGELKIAPFKPGSSQHKPIRLPLYVNGRKLSIQFKLINPVADFKVRRLSNEFHAQFKNWLEQPSTGNVESLLPPTEVHSALIKSGWSKIEPLFAAGIMAAINAILTLAVINAINAVPKLMLLNQIGLAVHVALFGSSLWFAIKAWRNAGIREQIITLDSKTAL